MKFTNGFWVTKPEYNANYARDLYEIKAAEDTLTLYMPYKKIEGRGDTLNIGMMTVECSSIMEDTLSVKLTGYAGQKKGGPAFEKAADFKKSGKVQVSCDSQKAEISSGLLSLCVEKGSPELKFFAEGKALTKTGNKGISRMKHRDGNAYIVTELSLDVGELIYGFGERFTPYVKNGQVVETWNEDGGTASEIAYKSIPFYLSSKNYGVFVNHPGKVSFETGSEKVESVQFSVQDEELEYIIIYGRNQKEVLSKYTKLTGRAPLLPKWSFGLWLTTSFTTDYDEKTITSFIDGMADRNIPLTVFHFDCFWMKGFEWCNFEWDKDVFPNPAAMLERMHKRGLKICVWINPYIAQKSPLFAEAAEKGYLLRNKDGSIWQWDMWQAGMGLVDFTNPDAYKWYQAKLKALLDMGVDCFKTDFGERIPSRDNNYDVAWFDGSDPEKMHNFYTYLYNKCVFSLLEKEKGKGEAILFARSATAGGQKFPVHWGGDSTSQFISMAESLRAGLSLMDSGFSFWSHDIGGFEDTGSADLYKRWVAFGLLSSHSRLHGSSSYRVPWVYDDEACDVLRFFTNLKCSLMPYIYSLAVNAHLTGIPVMRPMHLEFEDDLNCAYLDRQYMLGDSILVAPVFTPSPDGQPVPQTFYLPEGQWTHLISGKKYSGNRWITDTYDYFSLPVFVKENSIIPFGNEKNRPDYDYKKQSEWNLFISSNCSDPIKGQILDSDGKELSALTVEKEACDNKVILKFKASDLNKICLHGFEVQGVTDCKFTKSENGFVLTPEKNEFYVSGSFIVN
ncbi:alpha-xylosidase [Treponema sp. C6A8]|uniref:alpha-xylosidase n=1 Tax=Treponema sp. C6A8 TaxID=1410609 RepID=UPI0006847FD6|nr:alpha-xylosidase [Treponema sp. C6A8]